MLREKRNYRKPDPLMLITFLVSLNVFMTTAVDASETFFSNPNLPDLINGNIKLTEIGHNGAGIHMFYKTPANELTDTRPENLDNSLNQSAPDVFLSLRVPW
jgi:hypothetical protein